MSRHPNAKLIPRGRETLVSRIESGPGVAEAARQMGVIRQAAGKRLRRSRSGEGRAARRRGARLRGAVLDAARPARSRGRDGHAGAHVRRRGPVTPVRYERESPGELVHVDVKKVARIPDGGGWRALGRGVDPYGGHSGAGSSRLHVAVDDFSRVAYSELLPGERKGTCSEFMARCLAFFAGLGVAVERTMTDNGPGYRGGELDALLESEGVRHTYTRPYSPWQNGKVERMNRTLAQERRYGRAWENEAARAEALPAYIERYNWDRPHSACGGLPPMSRIVGVNNLLAHNI